MTRVVLVPVKGNINGLVFQDILDNLMLPTSLRHHGCDKARLIKACLVSLVWKNFTGPPTALTSAPPNTFGMH